MSKLLVKPSGDGGRIIDVTPADPDPQVVDSYWRRRRDRDPDLWVIELDSPAAERFVADGLLSN